MASHPDSPRPSPARLEEVKASLSNIRDRIAVAASSSLRPPTLVAVSKYKPASDIVAAYEAGQRDFGENYVNELLEKAPVLPSGIRWHFIGHLQSNKAKSLAAIPNLHTLHTLTSIKLATVLDTARASASPLNVFLQVNTSGEVTKSGLPPLNLENATFGSIPSDDGLLAVALHVITSCPNLRLAGLMTIGSLENSMNPSNQNQDFETLIRTREVLTNYLKHKLPSLGNSTDRWTSEGQGSSLILSMGMSSDFEAAICAGSGMVRVGTGIFGARRNKNGDAASQTT